jgi:aromatic ring-opening dioxygenase catalytic subunit (LigB family)
MAPNRTGHVAPARHLVDFCTFWFVPGTGVTISSAPRTIHDFGGFPRELYQVQYPAPGDPTLGDAASTQTAVSDRETLGGLTQLVFAQPTRTCGHGVPLDRRSPSLKAASNMRRRVAT